MAITIDISTGGNGIWTIEDDGTPGNGTSVVRDPNGVIFTTFAHPADSLTFLSRSGQSINVNITDSLTTANVTIGDLVSTSVRPDAVNIAGILTSGTVTLTANQTINEWVSDAATDIIASTLLLDAGTGIGTGGNAIETQVSVLEAESVTGGINLSNINNLVIGGATANLRGLFTGTSGNIVLVNLGSITLNDDTGIESVHSAGNLSFSAIGATANISSSVDQDSFFVLGDLFLNAGQDVLFGTAGADFDNDVRAGGSITISVGRDFTIDGFADLAADDTGGATGGGVTITAGRNITIDDVTGTDASIGVSGLGGGATVLTTGVGGTLNLGASSTAALFAGSGGVFVNADRILIESDSGISSFSSGSVNLRTASAGRGIMLGTASDGATALELSDAELDRIFAQNLVIGSSTSGQVSLLGTVSATVANVTLQSAADVVIEANLSTPTCLTLQAGDNVIQSAASTITTGSFSVLVDTPDTDAPGGSNSFGGALAVTNVIISGNADADTLTGTAFGDVINGGAQNDQLTSLGGNDSIFGGAGTDTSVYSNLRAAYTILTDGTTFQVNGPEGNDTLTDVEIASFSDISLFLQTGATNGADAFTAPTGNSHINGLQDKDTVTFNFALVDATVTYSGNLIIIDSASSHTELTGVERFVFTDGTIDNNDDNRLIDDLFYYSHNHDVWLAGADAEIHFNVFGWEEGRDPNAFFDTEGYLARYGDVAAAHVNPLDHYHIFGFTEGRDPSGAFDTAQYYAANPDVAAAHVDPLDHFLWFGQLEGRVPFADGVFA